MDYDEYVELAHEASRAVEAGEFEEALRILRGLVNSDISELDKAMMYYNVAVVNEKRGNEQETLAAYDQGMSYERLHSRCFVAEHKAGYLARIGRDQDSLRLYEELLLRSFLTEEEKRRMKSNVVLLRERLIPT